MITLSAYDCVEVDGYLYFFSMDYNILFKMEILTGTISIVSSIPEEKLLKNQLSTKMIYYKGCLYFAPAYARKIWRYCLDDGTWKGFELKEIVGYTGEQAFYQAILYKDKIFFFGCRYPAVVIFDLKSEEVRYQENVYADYLREVPDELKYTDAFFIKDCVQIDKYIYMASCMSNTVLRYDLDTYEYIYVRVGDEKNRYAGIGYDGTYFYLSPRIKSDAVRWDGKEKYDQIKFKYLNSDDSITFIDVFCDAGNTVFFLNYIDEKIELYNNDKNISVSPEKYWIYERINEETCVMLSCDGKLSIHKNGIDYNYAFQLEEDYLFDYIGSEIRSRGGDLSCVSESYIEGVMTENKLLTLNLYTKLV